MEEKYSQNSRYQDRGSQPTQADVLVSDLAPQVAVKVESDPISPYHDYPLLTAGERLFIKTVLWIYFLVLAVYVTFDLIYWDQLYDSSIEFTKILRSLPKEIPPGYVPQKNPFREFYAYIFTNIMYKWAPAIIPLGIIVHPRKDRGLAYVFLYIYNSTIRLLLMQTYRDRRPNWDLDVSDVKC